MYSTNHHQTTATEAKMEKYLLHDHAPLSPNQCTSKVSQTINAPLPLVWSIVRQFDNPRAYKQFIKRCHLSSGRGGTGSIREIEVVSGLPGETSIEKLDLLDDELHVMVFSIIGGDHKLVNYRSTTTLHHEGAGKTMVVESYVVDVPVDSSAKDTCFFADTIIGCNLKSLAKVAEQKAKMACGNGHCENGHRDNGH